MQDDDRCCGTGTCIIDAQGHCWCGQQWDGEKMCRPEASRVNKDSDRMVQVTNEENPMTRSMDLTL